MGSYTAPAMMTAANKQRQPCPPPDRDLVDLDVDPDGDTTDWNDDATTLTLTGERHSLTPLTAQEGDD
jgi:hypothetical protein